MDDLMMQLGVGGIFAVMVIKEVLSFLKSTNGKGGALPRIVVDALKDLSATMARMQHQVGVIDETTTKTKEMHDQPMARRADGSPRWWNSDRSEKAIEETATYTGEMAAAMAELVELSKAAK